MGILLLWRKHQIAIRTFILGLLLTLAIQMGLSIEHKKYAQTQLNQLAERYAEQIQFKLEEENHILLSLQSAFLANPQLTHQAFTQILKQQNIQGHFPHFIAIQFIREIPFNNLESYIQSRQINAPDFTVKTTSPRPVYQIIDFIYPDTPSAHENLGMDMSDQTINLIALEYSRDQGRTVTSAVFPLNNKKTLGFIINLPIYKPGTPVTNQTERRGAFIGSINVIISVENIITWLGRHVGPSIRVQLQDTGPTSGLVEAKTNRVIYPNREHILHQAYNELTASALIQFPGRQWRLSLSAYPSAFSEQNIYKYMIWFFGLTFSAAFAFLLQRQRTHHESALDLAEQITQDLRKHERHFQQMAQLAEQSRDLIISRDLQGSITYANRAARLYFADIAPVLLGKNKPLLLSAELAINETPIRQECQHRNSDNELHHFELTLFPLYSIEGQHEGCAMFAHDITQHKELLAELQNSRERFSSLVELASDWYWEQDKHFRFTQISLGFFKAHPMNRSLILGRCIWEINDGQLSSEEWRNHKAQLEAHQNFYDFIYTIQINEQRIVVSSSGQPYFNDKNEFQGYRGVSKEIKPNHEYTMQQETLISLFNSMEEGVIAVALNGEIELINPAAIQLLHCRSSALIGKQIDRVYRVISLEEQSPLVSLIQLALSSVEQLPPPREVLLFNTENQPLPICESVLAIKNPKGTLTGLALIFKRIQH